MLTDYEQDRLWETVTLLADEQHTEEATVLLKSNIERTLAVLGHSTDALSRIQIRIPKRESIHQLSELDKHIHHLAMARKLREANEVLVNYIGSFAAMTEDSSANALLASLLVQGSKTTDDDGYYSTGDVGKKLGLSNESVRRLCEDDSFPGAAKTKGGHWRIPKSVFRTTTEQDARAEAVLQRLDEKHSKAGDVDEFNFM